LSVNLYADLSAFRETYIDNQALDSVDQETVMRTLDAASRRTEQIARRVFYSETATRVLNGSGRDWMWIPDLLSATSIKLDEDGDRTFELTLASATDYYLKRRGFRDEDALPKTVLELDTLNGSRAIFPRLRRLVQIVGRWGFTEDTEIVEASGTAITGTLADATDLTLATSANADLSIGQTLKLENEQVFISDGTVSPWTVVRGVNGTTAAGHAAVQVNRYVYTPEVVQATLILAGRMMRRRESGYANVVSNLISGASESFYSTDPDVERLLADLTRGDGVI
jgi:hypothetical protein